jgi:hypothetical protein
LLGPNSDDSILYTTPAFDRLFDILVFCPAALEPKPLTGLRMIEQLLIMAILAKVHVMTVNAEVYVDSIVPVIKAGRTGAIADNDPLFFWNEVF